MLKRVTLVFSAIMLGVFLTSCDKTNYAEKQLKEYTKAWEGSNFDNIYKLIDKDSKAKVKQTDFVQRYKNIYSGIGAKNIKITVDYAKLQEKDKKDAEAPFKLTMDTTAGSLSLDGKVDLKKEDGDKTDWKIIWNPSLIVPGLDTDDKIKISTIFGKRGEIKDRNGNGLAVNGTIAEVGVVPGKLGADADNSKKTIADLLGVSVDSINKKLSDTKIKQDTFVSIKSIAGDNNDLKQKLSAIPGIQINDKDSRVYPLKEKAAHLIGYVQKVTDADVKKNTDWTYSGDDFIGKAGLELSYEKNLRSQNGKEIDITDSNGTKKKVLVKTDAKNGQDVTLTVDIKAQNALYDQLSVDNNKAEGIAMNPQTGEILGMVSTPSYNPNDFVLGMNSTEWNQLNNDPKNPLISRFQSTFCPGSSMKPIVAAIGIETSKLDPNAVKNITGLQWQKDKAWGDFYIARDDAYSPALPANLRNALVHSDNIYFAQTALDIGISKFQEWTGKFGFGEKVPLDYAVSASQIANGGTLKDQTQLANSGYGQADVLINPLHLATMYSAFVNKGSMIQPYLQKKDDATPTFWKSNVMSEKTADLLAEDLRQIVSDAGGTAHLADVGGGLAIAGKTGTAEIKASKDDKTGTELGWFTGFDKNNPNLLVTAMVEDVDKNHRPANSLTGSKYTVDKVTNIFKAIRQ